MLPWLFVAIILIALVGVALYFWQTRFNIPDLVYTPLPPYEIPDVILVAGLLVENRGRQPAPNVKITIQFEGDDAPMIHHMHVASADSAIVRNGGEQHTFASIGARSLRPHGRIFVYWAAAQPVAPRVSVTSFQPAQSSFLSSLLPHKTDQ